MVPFHRVSFLQMVNGSSVQAIVKGLQPSHAYVIDVKAVVTIDNQQWQSASILNTSNLLNASTFAKGEVPVVM